MDRYERMRSGDWPGADDAPNFPRMAEHPILDRRQRDWLADGARVAFALTLLALLSAFIR
jgi:hypothetical protein